MTCAGTSDLIDSGFDTLADGCDARGLKDCAMGWLTTTGNVEPGEIMTLRIAIRGHR